MYIKFAEIVNFRKLLSVRIDLSEWTTLFVGANNSGKTSALLALRKFLSPRTGPFETNDFTLCHWPTINDIGQRWLDARARNEVVELRTSDWASVLPTLDLWLHVDVGELHYVRDLIPTLDWEGGLLGVRLRLEPKELNSLYRDFLAASEAADLIRQAAGANLATGEGVQASERRKLTVWPTNLVDFLDRRLLDSFTIRTYALDASLLADPAALQAKPQSLAADAFPIDGNPLSVLIRVNDIPAQRGFGDVQSGDGDANSSPRYGMSRLSDQLRSYYARHLDPTERPDTQDLEALQAIEAAQDAFDLRLMESFKAAFAEVEGMNYPGLSDPRPRVSTQLKAIDGLNHAAAVSFEVDVLHDNGGSAPSLRLPEGHNGLGYQNLISMIFRLMSFRDGWLRFGKAAKASSEAFIEPLHLVLIEEPEAHLHAQVQQVFIKKAYAVLRSRPELGEDQTLRTQLVVSTHSSHVAHETPFAWLRYFRRLPAGMAARVPVSSVVNLSTVFGDEKDTEQFVTRYLRAQHSDLFFADAAVLVEGPVERMLLPNLIRAKHPFLDQCFITLLEIGGSHAHRLRPLLEKLGLLTLIVTDLDSLDGSGGSSARPQPNCGQVTNNPTLKGWVPGHEEVDALYGNAVQKIIPHDQLFQVRVAYQMPIVIKVPGSGTEETAHPYTFEDALAFENLSFFKTLDGAGLARKFREAITEEGTADAIGDRMYKALKDGKKAEFALHVLASPNFATLAVPRYVGEGLNWLESQLRRKQSDVLLSVDPESNE